MCSGEDEALLRFKLETKEYPEDIGFAVQKAGSGETLVSYPTGTFQVRDSNYTMYACIDKSLALEARLEDGGDHSCYYCNSDGWNDARLTIESSGEHCTLAESMTMTSSSKTVKTLTPCPSWCDPGEALVSVTVRSEDDWAMDEVGFSLKDADSEILMHYPQGSFGADSSEKVLYGCIEKRPDISLNASRQDSNDWFEFEVGHVGSSCTMLDEVHWDDYYTYTTETEYSVDPCPSFCATNESLVRTTIVTKGNPEQMLITIKKGDSITVAEYNSSSLSSDQTHELFKCVVPEPGYSVVLRDIDGNGDGWPTGSSVTVETVTETSACTLVSSSILDGSERKTVDFSDKSCPSFTAPADPSPLASSLPPAAVEEVKREYVVLHKLREVKTAVPESDGQRVLGYDPRAKSLVFVAYNNDTSSLRIWDARTFGSESRIFFPQAGVNAGTWSPSGSQLAVKSTEGIIQLLATQSDASSLCNTTFAPYFSKTAVRT